MRGGLLAAAALFVAAIGTGPGGASAAEFPTKPVTIIVAFSAGSNPDVEARALAEPLGAALGQPVVIKNVNGGSQATAINALQTAPADGYTLLVVSGSVEFTFATGLTDHPPSDFAFIRNLADQATGVYVRTESPYKTIEDVIAAAKANPKQITVSASGAVSNGNQVVRKIQAAKDVQFTYVPQNGGGDVAVAVLGGHVDMGVTSLANVLQYAQVNKVRVLTVAQKAPYPFLPDVPSWSTLGIEGDVGNWVGVIAKAGIPADVSERLIAAVDQAT
jgi:tripartite-type tricarboxylate transporter receptor subunit TctC